MNITWLKLDHNIITDVKLRRFSAQEKWAWITLLCLASQNENDRGLIRNDIEDIADLCDYSPQDFQYVLDKFKTKGMIDLSIGGIKILNWEKRQHIKPSDRPEATRERKRLQRARERELSEEMSRDVTPPSRDVTTESRPCHATDKDKDQDQDQELNLSLKKNGDLENFSEPEIEPDETTTPIAEPESSVNNENPRPDQKVPGAGVGQESISARFYATYNERKPALWANTRKGNKTREKRIKAAIREWGSESALLQALEWALRYAAEDPFWGSQHCRIDVLFAQDHLTQWVEAWQDIQENPSKMAVSRMLSDPRKRRQAEERLELEQAYAAARAKYSHADTENDDEF